MTDDVDAATAAFLIEAGHLKRTKRAGWWIAGVRDPESVAEHSYRVAVIAFVLATMEGCNADRAATLAVFHDLPETRLGDIPSTGKPFVRTAPADDVSAEQTKDLPPAIGNAVQDVISEFEAKETPEAVCAKDADRLECLLQAREYEAQGYRLARPWADTMAAAVRTESGRRLAEAAMQVSVDAWWRDIVSAYGRPESNPGGGMR